MWKAEHRPECKDPTRYVVVRVEIHIQNAEGLIIQKPSPEVVRANCESCHATAKWVD